MQNELIPHVKEGNLVMTFSSTASALILARTANLLSGLHNLNHGKKYFSILFLCYKNFWIKKIKYVIQRVELNVIIILVVGMLLTLI